MLLHFLKVSLLFFIVLFCVQCSKNDPYLITKYKVGPLDSTTTVNQLQHIYEEDSVVVHIIEGRFSREDDFGETYKIYTKKGDLLLTIEPTTSGDTLSTIKSVEINDGKFKTINGMNLNSSFKDIHYLSKINTIETSFTSVTLFIDELNATMLIDKKEMGLQPFGTEKIKLSQIPDLAKAKKFTVWLN